MASAMTGLNGLSVKHETGNMNRRGCRRNEHGLRLLYVAWHHALEWALPMNPYPIMPTRSVFAMIQSWS